MHNVKNIIFSLNVYFYYSKNMDLPKLELILKEKSKYSCKFCNTEDRNSFRELRYICCRNCENLCTKYRKYCKEKNVTDKI